MVDSLQKRVYPIAANVWIYQDPHTKELFGVCVGGVPIPPCLLGHALQPCLHCDIVSPELWPGTCALPSSVGAPGASGQALPQSCVASDSYSDIGLEA